MLLKKIELYLFLYIVYLPPVAFAIRFKSAFLQRRTAIAPASTNCFKQRSSIPPVVKITFAPALSNLATRSLAISVSLKRYLIII